MRRYGLAELVEASGMSEAEFGRRVGLSGSSLTKARRDGLIESAADRYACRAGLVPWLVWSDWLEDAFVECAGRGCTERFVQYRRTQLYCSRLCGNRERTREHLAKKREDPAFRAAEAERVKRYRSPAASRVASRLRRQRDPEAVRAYQREYRKRTAA